MIVSLFQSIEDIRKKKCIVEVFGLGYVGFPLSVRLASSGYHVIGIDTNVERVERLRKNVLNESELTLKEEFRLSVAAGKLEFVTEPKSVTSELTKVALICVPTPRPDFVDLDSNVYVKDAVTKFLDSAKKGDIIIIESSIEIGTTDAIKELIESKEFVVGKDIGLAFCPERIDPLNKKWNLENIPRIVYCSNELTFKIVQEIYKSINNGNLYRVSSGKVAEVVKSFENAFRFVNISLVNELAVLCDKLNISIHEVIDAAATKPFGFMPFYSGAGSGGHCIPKDPLFLQNSAKKYGAEFNTINTAIRINSFMPKYVVDSISDVIEKNNMNKAVIVCGLAYKPDIEDMRDSPGFKIINELVNRDYKVGGYDSFYQGENRKKYLIENGLDSIDFQEIQGLDDDVLSDYDCLCIVQHHTKDRFRISEIYEKNIIPFIYDCQNKIAKNAESKTILKHLGG